MSQGTGARSTTATVVEAVSAFCARRFEEVAGIDALAAPVLAANGARQADLAIEQHCLDLLTSEDPPLAGAGVVVAPHVLDDQPYWLEWWLAGPRRLAVELDPDAVGFRDYTELAWFDEPRRTGEQAITGPYVDYLCTDQYTLTFTAPIRDGDRFLGVAGVDVLARWFEQHLFTLADDAGFLDDEFAVVNASGRVVACPSGAWVTGDLIRHLDGFTTTPCPGTPFVVARRG